MTVIFLCILDLTDHKEQAIKYPKGQATIYPKNQLKVTPRTWK